MRKLLLATFAALLIGGAAFAQDFDGTDYWAGLSAGYPGAAVHFGLEDVTQNLDLRFNLGYIYVGDGGANFGVDALYNLDIDTDGAPVDVYLGGGVGADFGGTFVLKALGGAEFRLAEAGAEQVGVFAEVGPAFAFGEDAGFGLDGRLGVNYHF